jgi:hypothetical protein
MTAYKVTNEALGARGVGDILVDAGQTIESVELTEDEALALGEFDGVTVAEAKAEVKAEAKPVAAPKE